MTSRIASCIFGTLQGGRTAGGQMPLIPVHRRDRGSAVNLLPVILVDQSNLSTLHVSLRREQEPGENQ